MVDWIFFGVKAAFATFVVVSTYFGIRRAGGRGNVYATFIVLVVVGTSVLMFFIYDHGKYWFKVTDR